jgi:hypothetical protein
MSRQYTQHDSAVPGQRQAEHQDGIGGDGDRRHYDQQDHDLVDPDEDS